MRPGRPSRIHMIGGYCKIEGGVRRGAVGEFEHMTSGAGKAFHACLSLLASAFLAVSAAAQGQTRGGHAAALSDTKGAFGKSETIAGTLTIVDPIKGLIVVARRGPDEPRSLQLSWSEKASSTGEHGEMSSITVSQGPGETDYDFRITNSTVIEVNGVRQPLASLAALSNANVTVLFTPRRDGDFAAQVTITH